MSPPTHLIGVPGPWVWEMGLKPDDFPFLLDHGVRGIPIMPGSMYIELALSFISAVRPPARPVPRGEWGLTEDVLPAR